MGAYRRPFKFPAKSRVPLRLATGIAVAGLAWQASPKLLSADSSLSSGEKIKSAFDGVVRSSRSIYTITFIVVDYKYSLRSLPLNSSEYRIKLSELILGSRFIFAQPGGCLDCVKPIKDFMSKLVSLFHL